LKPETIDRTIEQARRELGPAHTALLEDFAAYLKDPSVDTQRGAMLSYRLGGTIVAVAKKANRPLAEFETPRKLIAMISLKQGTHDFTDEELRQLVYPSVWDRLKDD
jgi:hypothetical protein